MAAVRELERANAPQPPDGSAVLDVRGLRMRYGSTDADRRTFAARPGEVLALLGPNGAGKTTTIEILEGFRMRSAGDVSVLGVDPARGDERWRARIGVVLQSWRDHSKWRLRELLGHLGSYYSAYETDTTRGPWNVDELIEAVGLTPHANKRAGQLSGGQRRRLDVAIGTSAGPSCCSDEPTAGSTRRPGASSTTWSTDSDVDDTTILLTTHDLTRPVLPTGS
jgi:ABC-2 type transport system ATP-binding protein